MEQSASYSQQPSPSYGMAPVRVLNVHQTGKRIVAQIVDGLLLFGFWLFLAFSYGNLGAQAGVVTPGSSTTGLNGRTASVHFFLPVQYVLLHLLETLGYFVIFEWAAGATLGKLLMGIRVVNEQGGRISFLQSLTRNLLRFVDELPYFIPYLTGLVSVSISPSRQRLGDRVARTFVVGAGRMR